MRHLATVICGKKSASQHFRHWVLLIAATAGLTLQGCAITQKVTPASVNSGSEICIVENPKVREGFVVEYRAALQGKGYTTKLIDPQATTTACPVTSTYTARWSWDLTIYMSYAQIQLFSGGLPSGEALYDARRGGGRLDKFIDAETKIRELVDQLFPAVARPASGPSAP